MKNSTNIVKPNNQGRSNNLHPLKYLYISQEDYPSLIGVLLILLH